MTIAKRARSLPGLADGSGCAHVFVIPTQPEPPLGKCRLCGLERMHTNTGDGYEKAPWRAWNSGHGPANPESALQTTRGLPSHRTGGVGESPRMDADGS